MTSIQDILVPGILSLFVCMMLFDSCSDRKRDKRLESILRENGTLRVTINQLSTDNQEFERLAEKQRELWTEKARRDSIKASEQLAWAMKQFRAAESRNDSLLTLMAADSTYTCEDLFR